MAARARRAPVARGMTFSLPRLLARLD